MTNPFEQLGLPESLLVEPAAVEAAWQSLAREEGDADEAAAAARNEARALLSDPVGRLEAWLRIADPDAEPDRAVAPELMDLFAAIGPKLASTDALLVRHRQSGTALARALLAKEAVEAQLAVQGLLQRIQSVAASFTGRFAALEAAAASGEFAEARRALGQLKFLRRWEQQCRERLLALLAT